MSLAVAGPRATRYRAVFPDWHAPRPLRWFFMEQLLEARSGSAHPTNFHRPDEDVNVYLAHLLEEFVTGSRTVDPTRDGSVLWNPPERSLGRRFRAARYRAVADHRLLCLGLFDRGDLGRRHAVPWGRTPQEARAFDLDTGRRCYDLSANLLDGRGGAQAGLAPVLRKLAEGFEEYVQVLVALARRRFGLGAVLGEAELAGLMREPSPPTPAPPQAETMDDLLDLLSEWRRTPDPQLAGRIAALARRLDVDPGRLGLAAAG